MTVIDSYSRYLLACHLTPSYSAVDVIAGLKLSRAEAKRMYGALKKRQFLVNDNGWSFIARRFVAFSINGFFARADPVSHAAAIGAVGTIPPYLEGRGGVLVNLRKPATCAGVSGGVRGRYNERRPHWALAPKEGGDVLPPVEVNRKWRANRIARWQKWARTAQARFEEMLTAA